MSSQDDYIAWIAGPFPGLREVTLITVTPLAAPSLTFTEEPA